MYENTRCKLTEMNIFDIASELIEYEYNSRLLNFLHRFLLLNCRNCWKLIFHSKLDVITRDHYQVIEILKYQVNHPIFFYIISFLYFKSLSSYLLNILKCDLIVYQTSNLIILGCVEIFLENW